VSGGARARLGQRGPAGARTESWPWDGRWQGGHACRWRYLLQLPLLWRCPPPRNRPVGACGALAGTCGGRRPEKRLRRQWMAGRRAAPGTCGRRAGRCSTGGGPWHARHARRRCGSGSARPRGGGGVGESEAGRFERRVHDAGDNRTRPRLGVDEWDEGSRNVLNRPRNCRTRGKRISRIRWCGFRYL
jgi:hypothetical protein